MNWTKEDIHDLQLAGKIAKLTLDQIEKYVKPGLNIGVLHDTLIKLITKRGADLAFPPNISLDSCAAHDTASINEKRVLPKRGLLKIDIGANVNGMLSDTARTFSIDGKNIRLIKASREALNNVIEVIKPSIRVNEIGVIAQDTIEEFGFKPISNLTGHQLEKGILHAGLSIPSIKSSFSKRSKVREGMILAIEPFATNGKGLNSGIVDNIGEPLIFSSIGSPKTEIGKLLVQRFKHVPFSIRYAHKYLKGNDIALTDKDLLRILKSDRFHGYPPLYEKTGGLVSQAEHSVLVTRHKTIVLT
ncbi:MAG: M24 family metallopeptidase [Candidatus Hodarchaeales archaeon]